MTIKCVVPVSGGKDSQACLKFAMALFDKSEILGLFCDTKFEHPITYQHIENMSKWYGIKIETINEGSVEGKVRKYGRFPGGGARHCTDELKLRPSRKFYKALAEKNGGFEVWYGVRSDESPERTKRYKGKINNELYAPHEFMPNKYPKYLQKMGVMIRLPVIDMSKSEIFKILDGEGNPLYLQGFDRVGCFPCLASGDKWKEKAFAHDSFGAHQKIIVIKLSEEINKPIFTSISGKLRNMDFSGCSICSI